VRNDGAMMRTRTLRVPDDWRGLVDSWAVQVMLKDFSRSHVLSELVVDPRPGRTRLSLSLPEFRTDGTPESVFLRRLIASYLPSLKSFRSSQRVALPGFHGRAHEIVPGVVEQKALPAHREVWIPSGRRECELEYTRDGAYGVPQISSRLQKKGSSDPGRSPSGLDEASFRVLIALSIVAILVAVFFFRGSRESAPIAAAGTPMPGYKPWIPKRV
jgi:hypothetical protein